VAQIMEPEAGHISLATCSRKCLPDGIAAHRAAVTATPEEVKAMADEAFAVRVLDALTDQSPPVVRQHDGVHVTQGQSATNSA
jgi:hypothetical protein